MKKVVKEPTASGRPAVTEEVKEEEKPKEEKEETSKKDKK